MPDLFQYLSFSRISITADDGLESAFAHRCRRGCCGLVDLGAAGGLAKLDAGSLVIITA